MASYACTQGVLNKQLELKIQACCVNLSITWYFPNDIPIENFTFKYATTNYSYTALLKKVSTTIMEEILHSTI